MIMRYTIEQEAVRLSLYIIRYKGATLHEYSSQKQHAICNKTKKTVRPL